MPKKLRILIGFIKDKTSIIKATLTRRRHYRLRVSVVRATARHASAPPSDSRIASVLSLGHGSRRHDAGYACIETLMSRLHRTKNVSVALKSLFLLHIIITKGSFIIKNQLSFYPSRGGRNFLNLSKFRDDSDSEKWDLSSWVRWYSAIIEHNLTVSRFLGYYLSSSLSTKEKEERVLTFLSNDLLAEIDVLVDFVEVTSELPVSLHLQRKNLVYEIVRLVSDDYRFVQREILIRVVELRNRIHSLNFTELTQLLGELTRFESCKDRISLLFVNRNRNDELWELVSETKKKITEVMKEKGEIKLLKMDTSTNDLSGSSRFGQVGQLSDSIMTVDGWVWTRLV